LTDAAERTACSNNLRQLGVAVHSLTGGSSWDATTSRDAWNAGWNYGCGNPAPQYLLPYLESTGKYANCTVHIRTFQPDNFLDLSGCPFPVTSVSLLTPGTSWESSPYTRFSPWVVFNPSSSSTFSTGPCQSGGGWDYYEPDPWAASFVCNLGSKAMLPNAGLHFQVSFGPAQSDGRVRFVALADQNGLGWGLPATIGQ